MGTAGGIYHFRDEIMRGSTESFFVLNADIASSFPMDAMLKAHKKYKSVSTIMTTKVAKGSAHKFGCVAIDHSTMEVQHFVEKPESFISDIVSCGVYIFSPLIFEHMSKAIEYRRAEADAMGIDLSQFASLKFGAANAVTAAISRSSETPTVQLEIVFRELAGKKLMYAFECDKHQFWMSVKTGSSTIAANRKYLQYFLQAHPRRLSTPLRKVSSIRKPAGYTITNSPLSTSPGTSEAPANMNVPELIAPVYIHPSAVVHPSARIGPNVSIGNLN